MTVLRRVCDLGRLGGRSGEEFIGLGGILIAPLIIDRRLHSTGAKLPFLSIPLLELLSWVWLKDAEGDRWHV